MKELSRKVEQLSEKAVYGVMVETRQWSTIEVRPWTRPESSTKARIRFSKKFQSVPAVTASICAADVSRDQNFRVKVYGTDVDVEGFTIHADSWGNTILYSCGVMWTAIGR
ncbi:uncharacterized protein F4822DRAFT_384032 [Hypoxylon trugodes]|uniref:uncharacterized protein n=1 Tax=Hypoxylon trugodes TaxID=326681 RepID=UPI00218FBF6E|nr:uncharacterized protein F4822DRAFT_384032 [Hypoxylon trugodes]KAI1393241.1 hypothetical protein F4822DRAFT_384032 [Hypoxylon trugodes]